MAEKEQELLKANKEFIGINAFLNRSSKFGVKIN